MSDYVRRSNRKLFTEELLVKAKELITDGKKQREVVRILGINPFAAAVTNMWQHECYPRTDVTSRKTLRWQLKIFFHLIDLCLWNALFLYNFDKSKKEQMTYLGFRDSVIEQFLSFSDGTANDDSSTAPISLASNRSTSSATRPSEANHMHIPVKMAKRQRCKYCALHKKRTATFYCCTKCSNVALCVKTECFIQYSSFL